MEFKNDENNNLVISDEVIQEIAGNAAKDIPGVASVTASGKKKKFGIFGPSENGSANRSVIEIGITLKPGFKISDVAEKVQQNVKEAVQNMTGRVINRVNVSID